MGNFDSGQATLHEIGHSLGLKHGQDNNTFGVMNADRLDIEFSLMNYPNYIGSTEGFSTAAQSTQSYMMYDIAAFQYMYGANFTQVGRNNIYTWSATTGAEFINGLSQGTPVDNHIFETVWTEGANSTYDLSNFSQNQVDDMNPGGWMDFSTSQLADLNAFAPSKPQGEIFARADIYNALEYNGDSRSLIDNIITGSGNDTIVGNAANNVIDGGGGTNTFVETGNHTNYNFQRLNTGYFQIKDLRTGSPDGTDLFKNIQEVRFADGTYAISQLFKLTTALDLNGDGSSDLLWRNSSSGQVGIWNSNGSGGFTYQIINQGDPTWQIVGTGDFNGIGKDGILWRSTTSGQVGIWNSNGSGGFTYQINNEGDLNWQIQGVGDFNGDGKSDILWTNTNAGLVGLWDSNGSGGFTYQVFNQADPNWQVQGIGDFNGDGSSDILWRNINSGLIGLWNSNGSGGFTYQINPEGDPSWQIQGVGDFNGDGKSDILWRNTNSGQVGLWETNNSGGFTYQIFNESDPTWQIQGVGDFNGDGSADILWRNSSSGQIGIWKSNGSGGFTYQIIPEGDPTWSTFNGNDTLVASTADSTLYGNPGNTTFAIGPGAGNDTIYNFQNSQDTLKFNPALFANFAAAMTNATQVGANTVFAIDANDSVTLENVNKNSLAASNFRFA
jgi:hypothetical protein